MRLIAKKPCSFGGQQYFIGDEIPESLVSCAEMQEQLGVITITEGDKGSPEQSGPFFTQDQVDKMIVDAVSEIELKYIEEQAELRSHTVELEEDPLTDTVLICINGDNDTQGTAVPVTPGEIQQVFSVIQMNAEDGVKAIATITSDNVLILLHATDSRKTIKEAAKRQAENLFSAEGDKNEGSNRKSTTETIMEGVDT